MKPMTTILLAITMISAVAMARELTIQPALTTSDPAENAPKTIERQYPRLASGCLLQAGTTQLADGVLLRCGEIRITQKDLDAEITGAEWALREQLRKNAFFLLEQIATQRLLCTEARMILTEAKVDTAAMSDQQIIQAYLDRLVKDVAVADTEAKAFYEQNKDMVGGATFEQVEKQIYQYLLGQKKQKMVNDHIATLGNRMKIEVDAAWAKKQATLAADNPMDKALSSGQPSLVDFGSEGCRPCDMLAPILETLKTKYEGKANVIFISVRQEQILAARYGIQSIPVQIFFDKNGREVFRHTGFWPQEELEKKLADMGVK